MARRTSRTRLNDDRVMSRRAVLASLGPAVGTALAGCGGARQDRRPTSTSSDTDSDSYGIVIESHLKKAETITVQVKKPFSEGVVFERSTGVARDATLTWPDVVSGEEEQVIVARFGGPDGIPPEYMNGALEKEFRRDELWVTPGASDAPDVENFRIILKAVNVQQNFVIKTIGITYPGGPPTVTPCQDFGCGPG